VLKRQVPGQGPMDSPILLLGEAPGSTEVAGIPSRSLPPQPFIGWSGHFLQEMCEKAGVDFWNIRRDNVVQYQPERNDFSVFYVDRANREPSGELLAWHADLRKRILEQRPRVIIVAGDQPLYALTGNKSSTKWRGSVVPYESQDFRCWIVPIVHPSYARRCFNMTSSKRKEVRQPWFHITVFDLMKAKRVSDEGWKPLERTEILFPSYHKVMEYLEELYSMPEDTLITTDVETIRRAHIKCVGLTHTKTQALCIPFVANGAGKPFYSLMQEAEIWRMIDKVFNSHHICGQTIAFDAAMFWRDVGLIFDDNIYLDTAILHALLYPELKHDLGFLASMYTDMPYFKYLGRVSENKANIAQTFEYNCFDVESTHETAENLIEEAKKEGMWEYYLSKRVPLARWAVRQHRHGLAVDEERREQILNKVWYEDVKPLQDLFNECLKEVGYSGATVFTKTRAQKLSSLGLTYDETQEGLNVSSPQQVVHLLKSLGHQVADSSEETLTAFSESSVVAKTILELRSGYSLLGSIAKPTDKDGRFRTSINLHVTETTRLSSTKSHYGGGANMQNVTRKARPLFCGSEEE
jgi:uracil-DNA glycosylase family 4